MWFARPSIPPSAFACASRTGPRFPCSCASLRGGGPFRPRNWSEKRFCYLSAYGLKPGARRSPLKRVETIKRQWQDARPTLRQRGLLPDKQKERRGCGVCPPEPPETPLDSGRRGGYSMFRWRRGPPPLSCASNALVRMARLGFAAPFVLISFPEWQIAQESARNRWRSRPRPLT